MALASMREELHHRWAHKHDFQQHRAGAIARLHSSGHLNDEELAWAAEIAAVAERIGHDVGVRTSSFGVRVDRGLMQQAEPIGAVWREMAYSRWREALGPGANVVLDIVVRDMGLARAAATNRTGVARARTLLTEALHLWAGMLHAVRNEIDPEDVDAAWARLARGAVH